MNHSENADNHRFLHNKHLEMMTIIYLGEWKISKVYPTNKFPPKDKSNGQWPNIYRAYLFRGHLRGYEGSSRSQLVQLVRFSSRFHQRFIQMVYGCMQYISIIFQKTCHLKRQHVSWIMILFFGELNILKKIKHVNDIPKWWHNSPEPASNSNHDNDGKIHKLTFAMTLWLNLSESFPKI